MRKRERAREGGEGEREIYREREGKIYREKRRYIIEKIGMVILLC